MNENLDDRLRSASPTADTIVTPDIMDRATRSHRRPLHDWLSTSTAASRRGLAGGVAGVAALAIALPAVFPSQPALFALGSNNSAAASTLNAGGDEKMMMPYVEYNYIADASLSTAAGTGAVYRFELSGDVRDRAADVAAAFGVTGLPVKSTYFDETYPTWVVGSEDGSTPSVTISWSGTGSWWFNNPAAYPQVECLDAGQPGDAIGDDKSVECAEYAEPVTGLNPSEAEAAAIAFDLFTQLGYVGTASDLTTYRDEWGTTVTAPEYVDGQRVALDWSMNWSGNGEIAYAGGQSSAAVKAGTYETVSAVDAVARLDDWRWFGAAPMDGLPWMSARSYSVGADETSSENSAGEATEPAEGDTTEPTAEPTAEPEPESTIDPVPAPTESIDPEVTPEPLPTVTVMDLIINHAKPQLLMVWDNAGNAWLVPGFIMSGDEGWPMAVISLVEGVIELPEPMPIEPALID